jgi:hypothetical protein
MTQQEKAKYLVNKYYVELKEHKGYYDLETAIQCALIAVEEIIKNGGTINVVEYKPNSFTNDVKYWEEVKHELTNQQEQ